MKSTWARRYMSSCYFIIQDGEQTMCKQTSMTPDQSFFAVFCIEALADELNMTGDEIYIMLTEKSDILDSYIVPFYDVLHTQGKAFIVNDLMELMQNRGVV